MVATFKLSSEQLSSQDHYDFGMRAVNTVIEAAGLLKRKDIKSDEELLLLRALRDSNLPKFLKNDVMLFQGIISDIFPTAKPPKIDYGNLVKEIETACKHFFLQTTPEFIQKCIQLHETTILRHGLMLVGGTGGGKTSCYKVLQVALSAIGKYEKDLDNAYKTIKTTIINPKSITMNQLYGIYDRNTREWKDGILANEFREFSERDRSDTRKWLVFDGPVDSLWIESMNTVLDDNKKLCLVSGAIIELSSSMNILFEVEDLAVASPGF
jgi:dynein heavy chain, axonemal